MKLKKLHITVMLKQKNAQKKRRYKKKEGIFVRLYGNCQFGKGKQKLELKDLHFSNSCSSLSF